jgi:two-component system, chemotaxis family, sensor kinase CheA
MISEYLEVFMEELEEQLQLMDDEILKLEQDGESEEVIQSLFRAAHTLKGSSAAMGFEEMKQLTHEMEHLLDQVRSDKLSVSGPLIDLLFQSLDVLNQLKISIGNSELVAPDITGLVQKLNSFSESDSKQEPPVTAGEKPELSMDTILRVQEAQEHGFTVSWITVFIHPDCAIRGARALVIRSNLSGWGDVLLSVPEIEEIDEQSAEPLHLFYLFAGNQDPQQLLSQVAGLIDVADAAVEPLPVSEVQWFKPPAPEPAQATSVSPSASQEPHKSQTIRVNVERLDHLMNLVGELVIHQTRIKQIERLQKQQSSEETMNELALISDHISRTVGDLQESVMKARMLPIEQLFNRFPRMVRDLSRSLNKQIELIIEGKETELDRTLIEEIADPLIHLIRNAVDHGIESPSERTQAGKSPAGRLRLRALHEDNQVVIYVEDDGAGINPARMKESALKKGIIASEEAEGLSDREAIELIFRPGFSTAGAVSDISGRGVGMDIVKSHIEKLNGIIDIETAVGQGTCFKIKLPLTLAIIVGLLVKLNEQTFVIPMSSISEIVRVPVTEIQKVNGQSVILLREKVIPVVWLHEYFQYQTLQSQGKHVQLVVIGSAEKRFALAVDELMGNQEVVIKSLGTFIGKVDCIAGATILGDGKVALILEASSIYRKITGNI